MAASWREALAPVVAMLSPPSSAAASVMAAVPRKARRPRVARSRVIMLFSSSASDQTRQPGSIRRTYRRHVRVGRVCGWVAIGPSRRAAFPCRRWRLRVPANRPSSTRLTIPHTYGAGDRGHDELTAGWRRRGAFRPRRPPPAFALPRGQRRRRRTSRTSGALARWVRSDHGPSRRPSAAPSASRRRGC